MFVVEGLNCRQKICQVERMKPKKVEGVSRGSHMTSFQKYLGRRPRIVCDTFIRAGGAGPSSHLGMCVGGAAGSSLPFPAAHLPCWAISGMSVIMRGSLMKKLLKWK